MLMYNLSVFDIVYFIKHEGASLLQVFRGIWNLSKVKHSRESSTYPVKP